MAEIAWHTNAFHALALIARSLNKGNNIFALFTLVQDLEAVLWCPPA
jgi:hypothetical protein